MNQNTNEGLEQAASPTLCTSCQSFFSNVGCMGLCSKCYRENMNQQESNKAAVASAKAAVASAQALPMSPESSLFPAAASSSASAQQAQAVEPTAVEAPAPAVVPSEPASNASPSPSPPSNPNRCFQCKKKTGLTGFKCKCGHTFCGQHRYAESHACTFDYKTAERQKLLENNPVVQASKVQKL